MIRYFDMFAGIGGFRAGLSRAGGFQCVGHCEIDKYAHASYCAIHNPGEEEMYYPDARTIDPDAMPHFDLLCAGFPCQSYSTSGLRRGFADPRGTLFFEITRLAKARRPAYLLLENVPGILSHDQGRTFGTVLHEIHELGYLCEWVVYNSSAFGVPQSRKRVFIVGYLDPRCAGKILPIPQAAGKTLVQIIDGPQGYRVYDPRGTAVTQTSQSGGGGRKTGLYFVEDVDGKECDERAVFVDLTTGHPKVTKHARCLTARYGQTSLSNHKGERSGVLYIREPTKKGYKEAYPGDTVDISFSSVLHRGRVGHNIAHTLEACSNQGVVERRGRIRRLMPRECLRLHGFAEDQIDRLLAITSDAQAYKQAGNSVTVNVIEAIGRNLRAVDEEIRGAGA